MDKPFYYAEIRSKDRDSSAIFINTKIFNQKGLQNFIKLLKADIEHNAKNRKAERVANSCKNATLPIAQA